jgi:hypothetical protein
MRIFVKAKPNAKEEKVEKIGEFDYRVSVREAPIKGKANEAIINALAEYFKVPKVSVRIIAGPTSRNKIIDVIE